MSSLLGFSLVYLLQPYILPEPDIMPSMPLVLSLLLGFVLLSLLILFPMAHDGFDFVQLDKIRGGR